VAVLLESNELWVRVFVPETRWAKSSGPARRYFHRHVSQTNVKSRVQSVMRTREYSTRNVQTPEQREDRFRVDFVLDPAPELKAGMTATDALPMTPPAAVSQPATTGSKSAASRTITGRWPRCAT
jgi:hypothetical protein